MAEHVGDICKHGRTGMALPCMGGRSILRLVAKVLLLLSSAFS